MSAVATASMTIVAPAAAVTRHGVALTCDRKELARALALLNKVRRNATPKPVLACVLLGVTDAGVAYVEATDLEAAIRVELPSAKIDHPGDVVVSGKALGELARKAGSEVVRLSVEPAEPTGAPRLWWRSESATVALAIEDAADFPRLIDSREHADWLGVVDIHAAELRRALQQTIPATDSESSRYAADGVRIEAGICCHTATLEPGQTIRVIATDGRRLHLAQPLVEAIEYGDGWDNKGDAPILPTRTCKAIVAALAKRDDVVTLHRAKNAIGASLPGVTIVSRLMEGRFPRWLDVFPQRHNSTRYSVGAEGLRHAWNQASACCTDESRGVDCRLCFNTGAAELASNVTDRGQSRASHPFVLERAGDWPADPCGTLHEFTLDPRFVLQALDACGDHVATIDGVDPDCAFVLECRDARFSAVVMPLARDRN